MKRLICVLLLVCTLVMLYGCAKSNEQYLRIHIRANSNSEIDQNIKYKVKDIVVTYLTPLVKKCENIESVKNVIEDNHDNITTIIDSYLHDNGFSYSSSVEINNEFFPARTYDNLTLQADYYDAIIINLGEGKGNNWWCVVYPPLCFTGNNVVYKSKIVELINKYL